ncbi:MAG: AAA family ATPase [Deltaproteobacteria bacterium]|jgi:general secretion pathway protein A|nr:AAA family ATPase [Deltaproteobacteria bacterium]
MYASYFGLKENPFNLTPDPRYLYLTRHHKEAFDHLIYGINERKGFIVITGGIGTGKTTLLRALLTRLDSFAEIALIFNPSLSDKELLVTINQEFGIDTDGKARTKKEHLDILNRFLLETFRQGRNAVLLIDEAQNFSHNLLEEIRLLSNLETEKEKLIQIVLAGQPELKTILAAPALRQLNERISVRYDLMPLEMEDIQTYITHRLLIAGASGNGIFSKGAYKEIYAYSKGNPRRINAVSDRALLIAYARDEPVVAKKTVKKAIKDIRGDVLYGDSLKAWVGKRIAPVSGLFLLAVLVSGIVWRLPVEITQEQSDVEPEAPYSEAPSSVEEKDGSIMLNEETSFASLFRLFHQYKGEKGYGNDGARAGIVWFNIEPGSYVMFRKPFQMRIKRDLVSPDSYLVIAEVTAGGAVVIDSAGNEQHVSRSFILEHCDGTVSWFSSQTYDDRNYAMGMSGPRVLEFQRGLAVNGYLVKPTGIYDRKTKEMVRRFQSDFGLASDGIIGSKTRGLLYQMSD